MKKPSILLLLVICTYFICCPSSFAQGLHFGSVSGTLTDSTNNQPIPYANVVLLTGDKLFTGTTTDETGTFVLTNLPSGSYTMVFSFVGYRSKKRQITIADENPILNLGTVALFAESKTLSEVTVMGRKALVEDKGDRLVYNAEKDISNAGGMAADVLRKVPMLSVDLNGNVQMRGNGNIRVLINGKPSAMMARNLAEALRQMPAHIIKSVEVITSPGARYDAEGSAGVINIITKKPSQGVSGGINANAGNLGQGLGSSLMIKTGKIGLALSLSGYQYRTIYENEFVRTALLDGSPINRLTQRSVSDNTGRGAYGDLSLDYDPDSSSRINITASIWGGNFPNNSILTNYLASLEGELLEAFTNNIRYLNPYRNGQLDLGYTKTFKKPEHEFALLTQFSLTPNDYFYETDQFNLENQMTYQQQSTNSSRNKEYTIQTDYTYPFTIKSKRDTTSLKLEMGAKVILRDMGSESRVEESADGIIELTHSPSLSDKFGYLQRVYAGYTSFRINNQRHWSFIAGLRLEHTGIEADFITTQTALTTNYNNFIPSVTLAKGFNIHTIKASYQQRIQRPLIGYLNPWINQSNLKNVSTGNPYLDPELSHALELSHSVNTNSGLSLYSVLYWRFTNNAIESLSTVDTNGVSFSQPQNIASRGSYGVNAYFSGQITNQLYLNGGGDLRYVSLNSVALNQSNQGIIWSLNLSSSFTFLEDYTLQANGSYSSGQITIQNMNSGFYWYSFSIRRQFWKKKASLTLTGNNVFDRGVQQTGIQAAPTFYAQSNSLYINRSAQLTFDWRFGKTNMQNKKNKKIKNDDKSGQ